MQMILTSGNLAQLNDLRAFFGLGPFFARKATPGALENMPADPKVAIIIMLKILYHIQ